MPAQFDTGDRLGRAANVVAGSSDYTVAGWVKVNTFAADPAYSAVFATMNGLGTYTQYATFFINDVGFGVDVNNGSSGDIPGDFTNFLEGIWYPWAYVRSGTTQRVYFNRALVDSATVDMSATALSEVVIGGDGASVGDLSLAYVREFDDALNLSELNIEWDNNETILTADEWTDYPLTANGNDAGPNGYNLSATGSVTFGGTAPQTCQTATAVVSLPADLTVARGDAGTMWWSYTTGADEDVLSVLVSTDTDDQTFRLSSGACGNLTTIGPTGASTRAAFIAATTPVTAHKVRAFLGDDVTEVRLRLETSPNDTIAPRSLVVPSVFGGTNRTMVYTEGGTILEVIPNFTEGTSGDSLGNRALMQDGRDLVLYNAALTELVRHTNFFAGTEARSIRANQPTQRFWIGNWPAGGASITIQTMTAEGVLEPTSWTFATTAAATAILPSLDETVLYYAYATATDSTIYRYDLTNSVPMADFAADLGASWMVSRAMVALSDGSIIIGYRHAAVGPDNQVRRYDAAGTVLGTYTLPASNPLLQALSRVLPPDLLSVWVYSETAGGYVANPVIKQSFKQVRMTDNVVLNEFDVSTFENGLGPEWWEEPPDMFGPDSTAIFWPVDAAQIEIETQLIRRLRRSPHLSAELFQQFITRLQLDLQAGVGLSSGQGSDPQIMLRLSRDGGFTWGTELWTSAGALGSYGTRAQWFRLGRARDLVVEIAVSDPVFWAFFDLWWQGERGTS